MCNRQVYHGYWGKHGGEGIFVFVEPRAAKPPDFPDSVRQISPRALEVLEQVATAGAQSLDQLVGMGLRKALEFLIKDFAISENPSESEQVKKMLLAQCIKTYVKDANVLTCAERATWLGNDETHYVRKWESQDIGDLKTLIRLTINWIENVLLTARYSKDMP